MRPLLLACVAIVAAVPAASAQDGPTRCNAINTDSTREIDLKTPTGQYNAFFGGGIVVVCPSKKIHLKADSAEEYGDDRRFYLVGHVFYEDPRFSVHSDFLNYFMPEERIVATGNVDATMPSGSKLKGPMATYLRPIPKTRPQPEMTAVGRPTITLIQHDSAGRLAPPMDVTADRIFTRGDSASNSVVNAGGSVLIVRQDLTAHSDSMFLDGQRNVLHLIGNPKINGTKGDNPFTLVGTLLDLYSSNQKLNRVLARGQAVATSKDLTLRSDTIDFRVSDDVLERAMAWGSTTRAAARSPTDSMLADSIDVIMPHQRAREIHAIGHAYAESKPDTVKFHTKQMDWMRGDTILAMFDTIPSKDTTQAPRIKSLIAIDSAKAFYNMAARDTTLCVPAISYSTGRRIIVSFGTKGVEHVDVIGRTIGVLSEPNDSIPENRCPKPPPKKDGKTPPTPPDTLITILPPSRR